MHEVGRLLQKRKGLLQKPKRLSKIIKGHRNLMACSGDKITVATTCRICIGTSEDFHGNWKTVAEILKTIRGHPDDNVTQNTKTENKQHKLKQKIKNEGMFAKLPINHHLCAAVTQPLNVIVLGSYDELVFNQDPPNVIKSQISCMGVVRALLVACLTGILLLVCFFSV